jgi:hypothetical protein
MLHPPKNYVLAIPEEQNAVEVQLRLNCEEEAGLSGPRAELPPPPAHFCHLFTGLRPECRSARGPLAGVLGNREWHCRRQPHLGAVA